MNDRTPAQAQGKERVGRSVTFDCGHTAEWRIARCGHSLVGAPIRCHECCRDRHVVTESAPFTRVLP